MLELVLIVLAALFAVAVFCFRWIVRAAMAVIHRAADYIEARKEKDNVHQ